MSVMDRVRKIFPMNQVDVKRLEQTPERKEQQTVYKYLQNPAKKVTENGEEDAKEEDTEYEILEREILPEKIVCPECGGITLEGLEFCDKCGGDLRSS